MTPLMMSVLVFFAVAGLVGLVAFLFRQPNSGRAAERLDVLVGRGSAQTTSSADLLLRQALEEVDRRTFLDRITPEFFNFRRMFEQADVNIRPSALFGIALTLGGVAGSSILIEFAVLASFAVLGAGLGIFLSTILPKPTGVVIAGYVLMAAYLAAPLALEALGVLRPLTAGAIPLGAAVLSPLHDLIYVFQPSWFVASQSFPESWWICPLWNAALGHPGWSARGPGRPGGAARAGAR